MFLSYVTWRTYSEIAYSPWNIQSFSDTISADMLKRKNDLKFYWKAGQNDRWGKKVTSQESFLAGHCPVTGRYFEPCPIGYAFLKNNSEQKPIQ